MSETFVIRFIERRMIPFGWSFMDTCEDYWEYVMKYDENFLADLSSNWLSPYCPLYWMNWWMNADWRADSPGSGRFNDYSHNDHPSFFPTYQNNSSYHILSCAASSFCISPVHSSAFRVMITNHATIRPFIALLHIIKCIQPANPLLVNLQSDLLYPNGVSSFRPQMGMERRRRTRRPRRRTWNMRIMGIAGQWILRRTTNR